MRGRLVALVAVTLSLAAAAPARGEEDWKKLLEGTSIDLLDALERGIREAGPGTPFHVELEEASKGPAWSVDVAQGTKTVNVVLDAKTGAVLEKETEEEDHSAVVEAARATTLAAVVKAALATTPGRAVEAHLLLEGGKPVYRIRIMTAQGVALARLDGATGKPLLAVKPGDAEPEFTDTFRVEPDEWASQGKNPWFVLEPGYVLVLEGTEDGKPARLTVTVLAETKTVDGVETRVVEEREEQGGELVEVSRNFFAISKKTNSVYYFGEDVDEYEGGKVAGHPGAWRSGEKGARFGLMMPGTPLLGARYYQEVAPGVAMDRAEIVSLRDRVETPAGTYADCLTTKETTSLERGEETKSYAPGIGLVRDAGLRLVRSGRAK